MHTNTKAHNDKKENIEDTLSLFKPVFDFHNAVHDISMMLTDALKRNTFKYSDIFEKEISSKKNSLAAINKEIENLPKDEADFYKSKTSLQKLLNTSKEIVDKQLDILTDIQLSALPKALNSDIGQKLLKKLFIFEKYFHGGAGASTIGHQTAYYKSKNKKLLYMDIDQGKISIHGTPSSTMSDGENNLKIVYHTDFSKKHYTKTKARLKNKTYTNDITIRRETLTRSEEFMLLLYKAPKKLKLNLDFYKFMRLKEVTKFWSLFILMRLFIDFPEELDKYDIIFIDSGPLQTNSHGFLYHFLQNHIITIPEDDYDISKLFYAGSRKGVTAKYNEVLETTSKLYNSPPPFDPNIILLINEREFNNNITATGISESYQKLLENRDRITNMFIKNTGLKEHNIINTIIVPNFWQPIKNNKSDSYKLPIIFDPNCKYENKAFENTIIYFANVIDNLIAGKSIPDF